MADEYYFEFLITILMVVVDYKIYNYISRIIVKYYLLN